MQLNTGFIKAGRAEVAVVGPQGLENKVQNAVLVYVCLGRFHDGVKYLQDSNVFLSPSIRIGGGVYPLSTKHNPARTHICLAKETRRVVKVSRFGPLLLDLG